MCNNAVGRAPPPSDAVYVDPVPRRRRAFTEGIYHVGSHGSDDRALFRTEDDGVDFLERLAIVCREYELDLLSYTLMSNHYHALIHIPDSRLSRALQRLHTEYSRHHNRRCGRSAHLFRAHPFAREIESDEDLVATCRYLALNPVDAGLASDPLDWPWSSARAHAGLDTTRIPLAEDALRAAFGDGDGWRELYRAFVDPDRRA
jgi:REP element-mobilizing transposase RayT